jgi:hypothetical protein
MGWEPYLARIRIDHMAMTLVWCDLHVPVDWILRITTPVSLNGANTSIRADIAPKAAAGNHLPQAIYVGAVWKG